MNGRERSPVAGLAGGLLLATALVVLAVQIRAGQQSSRSPGKSSAAVRAARRAYDGAPPVIPHPPLGAACVTCHKGQALIVPGVGVSPPMPHDLTPGPGRFVRCRQCHVFRASTSVFKETSFVGIAQTLSPGRRLYPGAPPAIPHRMFLREDCAACHTGPAARERIRCSHPDRPRCVQCHVPSVTNQLFVP